MANDIIARGIAAQALKKAEEGGGGSRIETIEVTVTKWGTMDDPVHTNLAQEQMEKLNNGALIKIIDESAEWEPTICYPCAEITEENTVAYFSWISNATDSSGMHKLFQYLVAVDFLNSILTPMIITHELDTARMNAITDANGNPRFLEGNISTGTFSGVTFTYAKWSLSGTHLMLVVSMDLTSMASFTTVGTVIAYAELPEYIYNKIFGTVLDWKNTNVFSSTQMINNIQIYLMKQNNRIEFVTASNYGGGTAGTDRIQFDLLIDSE